MGIGIIQGNIGIMEENMKTTVMGYIGFLGFGVWLMAGSDKSKICLYLTRSARDRLIGGLRLKFSAPVESHPPGQIAFPNVFATGVEL